MMIKDLEISKELSGEELSAVRGGFNIGVQSGAQQYVGGGILLGSPTVQVAPQTMTQTDYNLRYDSYTFAPVNVAAGVANGAFQLA